MSFVRKKTINRPEHKSCTAPSTPSNVDHPPHYNQGKVEVISIIEQIIQDYPSPTSFSVGQVIKYLARAPYKGTLLLDLQKAEWYLKKALYHTTNPKPKIRR